MAEISYYFNTYNSGGEEWVDYPQRMVDNDLLFSAQSPDANVPDIQLLTGNTCDGTDLGTISKVELRNVFLVIKISAFVLFFRTFNPLI